MRTYLVKRKCFRNVVLNYLLLVDPVGQQAEAYGICVASGDGMTCAVKRISFSQVRIFALLERLIRNSVTPVTLRDVVEDWLLE